MILLVILALIATSANASPPKVIKTVPENGQQDVDPALRVIRIVFDQDMDNSGFSICGGGPKFPELLGKPRWVNKRTLVAGVKLKPSYEYQMSINCPSYQACKNVNGEPAEIYPINFKTAPASSSHDPDKSSQSPAVLLQQGIYAEETEGNLDKAMDIYGQIRQKYNDVERIAARATYQLGLCNLKKGDNKKAAELFQEVIGYYPEQIETVQMAQQQLDKLGIKNPARYTQEIHNEIEPNGLISFYMPHHIKNTGSEPITNDQFMNSDFINLQKIIDSNNRPVQFTTTHQDNCYHYNLTFNPPIMPGEELTYITYGTITGLVNIVPTTKDTWRYFMNHSPNSGVPTLRIETYLLPEGAELISTTPPDMEVAEKNGRIELRVEKTIPANGSLTTSFQYRITGAKPAVAKPLKLESAPWVDGEVMELVLKHPAGNEYGTIIYSVQKNKNNWQIISHMYVNEASISQYTFVEADANSFAPIYGQTTNWMGDFVAEYGKNNVKLTINAQDNQTTRDIPVSGVVYDNEQAVYLIRRMPLAESYEGSFPIFTIQAGVTVDCMIKVLAVEEVTVKAGTFKCYKTELSINSQGVKTLQHTLWFSADEHKYLVKYDVGGAATMEMAKVWQRDKNKPIIFENVEPAFSAAVPADWRFYKYSTGPQTSLQLMPPENKAWAVLIWQQRGTDPNSASAMTIAKADCEKLKGFFENYVTDQNSWKELKINSLEAVQYLATYQESGNRLQKYSKPQNMLEYRTYIVDTSNVYWFVFRIEKDKFEENKAEFDSIVNSFKANAK